MSNKDYRFAFFGTPQFAVNVLDALEAHGMLPALVVCAPDRPQGRGQEVQPPKAKVWALERGIDVLQPATLKDPAFIAELQNTEWDFFVVAAYAKLIGKTILDMPARGCINVHPSLLPKLRGPSPALSAILTDEKTTGVSLMLMDEQMDHGPIIAQARIEIEDWPPQGSVFEALLATEGGNLLAETIEEWMTGSIDPVPQDESKATFTHKFTPEDARIDLSGDAYQNMLKIAAFDKNPRAHTIVSHDGKDVRLIITEAALENGELKLLSVIPEGKREMSYADFLRG